MSQANIAPLRLAFMGTPDFATPALRALAGAGHEIAVVYSQPPRPAGRGHKPRPSPVQALAEERGWPLRTPTSLKNREEQAAFAALNLDAAVVVAYGLILPEAFLAAPRLGCLNIHASLLPRWRGAAPIQRAILAGDSETGVTIMRMDAGLDTGPMLLRGAVPIGPGTDAAGLHDSLADLGARLILEALSGLAKRTLEERPQPSEGVTYAAKLSKAESRLDWRLPAVELERQVRAFTPWPGARADLGAVTINVLAAEVVESNQSQEPGTFLGPDLTLACGDGALRLTQVQRPGKAAMAAADFLRGFALTEGTRLPEAP